MRNLLMASSLFVLAGCATTTASTQPPRPVAHVDAQRFYAGTWYEIGRRPMSLTDGCVAGGTTYTRTGDDRVTVLDFCHSGSPTGALKTIGGPARIVDPGTNAKLHVRYRLFGFLPVPRDYWVLAPAEDGRWFISADPSFHDLWIYTRSPNPSAADLAALVARAKALGYDTGLLEFPTPGA